MLTGVASPMMENCTPIRGATARFKAAKMKYPKLTALNVRNSRKGNRSAVSIKLCPCVRRWRFRKDTCLITDTPECVPCRLGHRQSSKPILVSPAPTVKLNASIAHPRPDSIHADLRRNSVHRISYLLDTASGNGTQVLGGLEPTQAYATRPRSAAARQAP